MPQRSGLNAVGGTKFVLALVSTIGTQVLCAYGRIDGSVYMAVSAAVVGAYLTSDVLQRKHESSGAT